MSILLALQPVQEVHAKLTSDMYISPCLQICRLDRYGVCIGCGRTKQEIAEWPTYHYYQRMKIMERLGYGKRRGVRTGGKRISSRMRRV